MGTFGGDGDSLSYPRPSPRRAGGTLNFTCKRKKKKEKVSQGLNGVTGGNDNR